MLLLCLILMLDLQPHDVVTFQQAGVTGTNQTVEISDREFKVVNQVRLVTGKAGYQRDEVNADLELNRQYLFDVLRMVKNGFEMGGNHELSSEQLFTLWLVGSAKFSKFGGNPDAIPGSEFRLRLKLFRALQKIPPTLWLPAPLPTNRVLRNSR